MTEDEARGKWCPMTRGVVKADFAAAVNASGEDRLGFCIASDCMMWRIREVDVQDQLAGTMKKVEDGYCGLAGKL